MDREAVMGLEVGSLPLHLSYDAVLSLGYGHNLLMVARRTSGGTQRVGALVGRRFTIHVGGAVSLYQWVQIGVGLPLVLYQARGSAPSSSDAQLGGLAAGGMGDLRISPKLRLLRASDAFVDLAFIPVLTLPTAVPGAAYLGERSVGFAPTAVVSRRLGPLRATFNMGYRWRKSSQFLDLKIGPEVFYGVGATYDLASLLALPIEASGTLVGGTSATAAFASLSRNPMELLFQGAYPLLPDVQAYAGGAVGIVAGFGTPDFRIFCGVRYAPRPADRDGDGVPDSRDDCLQQAEDSDGFEDEDGCPDLDNDDDGIADDDDSCPDAAETENGVDDQDGCPEGLQVEVARDRLKISDTVAFKSGRAIIEKRSYSLLEAVADTLNKSPGITKIRVAGHTDDRGDAEDNLALSQNRADAVMHHLVGLGIDKGRLEAVGYGETKPVASNSTARGRAVNRRVEFIILEESQDLDRN